MTEEQFIDWAQSLNFCWDGHPADAIISLRSILQAHEHCLNLDEIHKLIPDSGVQMLILYWIDGQGLTEHGGSVFGAWLTDKGLAILNFLKPLSDLDIERIRLAL
jgi:hypothetical protein